TGERTVAGGTQHTIHFTGSVRLLPQPPQPAVAQEPAVAEQPATDGTPTLAPAQVYRLYFHGPAYQVVGSAWRHGDGVAARFRAGLPAQADVPTLIGPRLVELCFQAAGLWEAGHEDRLALPLHVDAVRLATAEPVEDGDLVATARPNGRGGFDCVVRRDGRVVLWLDGYRTVPLPDPLPEDVSAPIRAVVRG
ncbi:MAG TPA: polyketide synthase dehydratase domain-containing protein, partial [Pilimelia sp.]|nr:polyketide synthase dehydratase domain-containing protein [Pilimelia sp.]